MRYLLTALTLGIYLLTPAFTHAGGNDEFEDLLALYIDEDYEKLMLKAYKYTQNDNYKKHPLPYIYCSMGYYEMSKDMKYQEDYPRAQQDALKYAVKFRKKDKDNEYWDDFQDYMGDLRTTVIEDAENMLDNDKTLRKSHKIYRYLTDMDPSDMAAWLMRGYCEVRMRVTTEAEKSLATASSMIEKLNKIDDLGIEQQRLLKFGLITYSNYLLNEAEVTNVDSAARVIDLGHKFFEDDEEYKKIYEEIQRKK